MTTYVATVRRIVFDYFKCVRSGDAVVTTWVIVQYCRMFLPAFWVQNYRIREPLTNCRPRRYAPDSSSLRALRTRNTFRISISWHLLLQRTTKILDTSSTSMAKPPATPAKFSPRCTIHLLSSSSNLYFVCWRVPSLTP